MRTMAQPRCSGSHPPPSSRQSTSLTGDSSAEEAILAFDADDIDVELPHNVDLIPSSRALQNVDTELARKDIFYNPNECLHAPVRELKALGRYDYIFIDTGPQASPTTRSAYLVSDYFILSLVPEKLAVDSLPDALQDIAHARRPERNPKLYLLGLILSCMDRRVTLAKRYEDANHPAIQAGGRGAGEVRHHHRSRRSHQTARHTKARRYSRPSPTTGVSHPVSRALPGGRGADPDSPSKPQRARLADPKPTSRHARPAMRRRPASPPDEPLDIFDDDRFKVALAGCDAAGALRMRPSRRRRLPRRTRHPRHPHEGARTRT